MNWLMKNFDRYILAYVLSFLIPGVLLFLAKDVLGWLKVVTPHTVSNVVIWWEMLGVFVDLLFLALLILYGIYSGVRWSVLAIVHRSK
ncbi:hypothetical protein [Alicyclobacillus dauci]|uniref:Uncharacterized protein n=1 Tax=Alicyclobacillus dauci TaxID=1475485 RepID=A0ABY6YX63_9BACL|nr:hypothetical protein [Alicyclobacillus dauci]WAH35035.1 hypothetical protein NZD86_11915 [Alicyclobacillus dauci]